VCTLYNTRNSILTKYRLFGWHVRYNRRLFGQSTLQCRKHCWKCIYRYRSGGHKFTEAGVSLHLLKARVFQLTSARHCWKLERSIRFRAAAGMQSDVCGTAVVDQWMMSIRFTRPTLALLLADAALHVRIIPRHVGRSTSLTSHHLPQQSFQQQQQQHQPDLLIRRWACKIKARQTQTADFAPGLQFAGTV